MEQDAVYFSAEISDPVEGLSPGQTIATFLGARCCARLVTLLQGVARCCHFLGFVGLNLKMVKILMQHSWMLHDVVVVCPGLRNNVALKHAQYFDFQYPTCRNALKQGGQTHATCCAQQCWDMLC